MPVVYNGVDGSGQGDLFDGLKLWIAHRVPQRDRMINLVKGNGGGIVKLEKNADMLIADHLKAGGVSPPPGAYSWKWIDASVKNGFLEDKNDYLIGRKEGSSREAGAAEKTKVGRHPFTKNDDLILTKWILAEEMRGNSLAGRKIYVELERRHPGHTWQSWRDRWVKTLSKRPHPDIPEEELQAEAAEHDRNESAAVAGPSGSARPVASPARPDRKPRSPPSAAVVRRDSESMSVASPGASGGLGRNKFTDKEDQLLLAYIQAQRQKNREAYQHEDSNLKGNVIYKDFAAQHPTHTWQSWRDRWVRILSLRESVDDAGPDDASNANPERTPQRKRQRPDNHVEVPATAEPPSPASEFSGSLPQPILTLDGADGRKPGRGAQVSAAIIAQIATLDGKEWRGHDNPMDQAALEAAVVDTQSLIRGYVARMKFKERQAAALNRAGRGPIQEELSEEDEQFLDAEEVAGNVDIDSNEPQDSQYRSPRDQFWSDLDDIVQAAGLEVDKTPTIDGGKIDLWELYRSATQQNCEPEERDWKLVAQELGLEPTKSLIRKVQACYLQNLADFEDHMKEFEGEAGEEEEAGDDEAVEQGRRADSMARTSDAVTAPKQPLSSPVRSSPPVATNKRSFEQTDLLRSESASYPSSGPRKRRRLNRSSVIPPTPEDKLGPSDNSHGRSSRHHDSSPLKQQTIASGEAIEISSGDESDELPLMSELPKKMTVEPETQDWHMEPDRVDPEDEDETSPSQQLHLESDALHLPSSPVTDSRGLPDRSGRALRSRVRSAAVSASVARSSRAPVTETTVMKRTIPAHYDRKPAVAAASAPVPPEKRNQPQPPRWFSGTSTARVPSSAPARTTAAVAVPRSTNVSTTTSTPSARLPRDDKQHEFDDAYVAAQIRHFQSMGYKEKDIVQAMLAASYARGPMIVALQSLHQRRGLPQDQPGVWTGQDDNDLKMMKKYERQALKGKGIADGDQRRSADHKVKAWKMKGRLVEKHGTKGMKDREEFLRQAGEV